MLDNKKDYIVADQIIVDWNTALANKDVEGLLELYTTDAVLESPLICCFLNQESGICRGKNELRNIFELFAKKGPSLQQVLNKNYYSTDGTTIMWECPRLTTDGEQLDFVEVLKLKGGLIQHHKVYWGWQNFKVFKNICGDKF